MIDIFDGHKAHVRAPDGFADRLRICQVVLVCLEVWFDELWSHQAHGVPHCLQFACPVMRAAACLNADQARRQVDEVRRHLRSLELLLQNHLTVLIDVRCSDKQGTHCWAYDLPALTTLEVMGGHHQFDALQAPQLENVQLTRASAASLRGLSAGRSLTARDLVLESLDGLGTVQDLRLWDCTVKNLSGVESAVITELDLTSGTYSGLAAVGRIATLQTLKFNSQLPSAVVRELPTCPEIRALEIPGYAGSLAFLSTWTALEELDLRNSGKLTDLDALAGLTALQKIRIRGATIKKDSWPAALKDSLDTK